MPLSAALTTALTGLQTAQLGLQTTAQNIANVNTQGFVRRTIHPASLSLGSLGAGVQLAQIRREVDDILGRDFRETTSILREREMRREFLSRVEQMFGGAHDEAALGNLLSGFRNALEALATAPENLGLRSEAIRVGRELALRMNEMSTSVQQLRKDAEDGIAAGVADVNTRINAVAGLNVEIARGLAAKLDVNDLLDQRDRAVMAIAEQMKVTTYSRSDGSLVVATAAGRVLVDGGIPHLISYTQQNTIIATTVFNAILLDGVDITNEFQSGKLAALVEQRDATLPARTAELNQLALQLRNNVFSASLATTDLVATAAVNEINRFFAGVDPASSDNAGTIQVHPDLIANPNLLNDLTAARDLANAAASNAIAFAAAGDLAASTAGFPAYGNAILTRQAQLGAAADANLTYQRSLHAALENKISEISGVNLDEEMARMVTLQQAYNAAARMIQTATEMLRVLDEIVG